MGTTLTLLARGRSKVFFSRDSSNVTPISKLLNQYQACWYSFAHLNAFLMVIQNIVFQIPEFWNVLNIFVNLLPVILNRRLLNMTNTTYPLSPKPNPQS